MTRHLHPHEIERLVDGDGGLDDLSAHAAACATCERAVRTARALASALDAVPHVKPTSGFAERVMTSVQVRQPWIVAAWEAMGRLVATGSRVRRAASGLLATGATATAVAGLALAAGVIRWPALEALAVRRAPAAMSETVGIAAGTLLGPSSAGRLAEGSPWTMAAAAVALLTAVAVGVGMLLRAGAVARRREDR